MTLPPLPAPLLAADAYEALIERAIVGPTDFYDLDRETFLRTVDGRVETSSL